MLLIDCGNTRIKWKLVDGGALVDEGAVFLDSVNVESFQDFLLSMAFDRVLVASVSESDKLRLLLSNLGKTKLVKLLTHRDLGDSRQFAYKDVSRLGIDRCLVIVAARSLSEQGCLVIDSGSALTADFISHSGKHMGGYIFPGYRMLQASLTLGTSNINVHDQGEVGTGLGRDTESCVLNAVNVLVSQAVKYLEELCRQYGIQQIYVTGGDAPYISRLMTKGCEVYGDLVFKGMYEVSAVLGFEGERV